MNLKQNSKVKRIFSLIICIAIIIAPWKIMPVIADLSNIQRDYYMGFENVSQNPYAMINNQYEINSESKYCRSGSKSLKINRSSGYENLFRLTDENGNTIVVNNGEKCVIHFYVCVSDEPNGQTDNMQITPFLTAASLWTYSQYNPIYMYGTYYGVSQNRMTWQEKTIEFTSSSNNTMLALDFAYKHDISKTTEILYVDDISVSVIPSGYSYVKLNYSDDSGEQFTVLSAQTGSKINLPTPQKTSFTFVGWRNKATGEYFSSETMPDSPIDLVAEYAGKNYFNGYEDVTAAPASMYGEDFRIALNTDKKYVRSGNKSLRLNRESGDSNLFRVTDNNGNAISVNQGETCILHFYYLVSDVDNGATNNMLIAPFLTESNIFSYKQYGTKWQYGKLVLGSKLQKMVWNEVTFVFTSNDASKTLLALDMAFNRSNPVEIVYLDDISVSVVPNGYSYMQLKYEDDSGSRYQVIQSRAGSQITLPSPQKQGYQFDGWYNEDTATLFTSDVMPDNSPVLIAKYIKQNANKLDFENGIIPGCMQLSQYSINNNLKYVHSGGKSLRVDRSSGYQNLMRLTDENGENIYVNRGDTCVIHFYALISDEEKEFSTDDMQIASFLTKSSLWEYKWYKSQYLAGSVSSGLKMQRMNWQEFTFTFTSVDQNYTFPAIDFAFAFADANTFECVYIDDISISVISNGNSCITLNYENDSGKQFDVYQAKAGRVISLPTPEKTGYKFLGWFNQKTGEKFTSSVMPEDSVELIARFEHVLYSVGFEDGLLASSSNVGTSQVTQYVKNGSKSLMLKGDGISFVKLTENKNAILLENERKYVVDFFYKLSDPKRKANNINISLVRTNNSFDENKTLNNMVFISKTTIQNEWVEESVIFETDETDDGKFLAIEYDAPNFGESSNAKVYIDEITVRKLTEDEGTVTLNYGLGHKKTLVGLAGEKATIPATLQNDKLGVENLYSDSQRHNIFDNIRYTVDNTDVYADTFVIKYKQNFDNLSNDNIIDNQDTNATIYMRNYIDDRLVYDENNSLHINGNKPSRFCVMADDGFKLKAGKSYNLSMYVKTLGETENKHISIYGADDNSIEKVQVSFSDIDISSIESEKWVKMYATFIATKPYIVLESSKGLDIYYDQIVVCDSSVEQLDDIYEDNSLYKRGDVNHDGDISAEDLALMRKILLGVETPDYVIPVDVVVDYRINILDLVGLKKMISNPSNDMKTVGFEDYASFLSNKRMSDCFTLDSNIKHSGNYSLKCDYPGTVVSSAMLNNGKKPLTVETGATYIISYWIYVESGYQSQTWVYFLTSNISDFSKNNRNMTEPQGTGAEGGAQRLFWDSPVVGKWTKHTTVFKVPVGVAPYTALNVAIKGVPGPRVVYLDDFSITKIENGNNYLLYHTNNENQDDYIVQGAPGQRVESYTQKAISNEYVFEGWFKENSFINSVPRSDLCVIPAESMTLYGKHLRVSYIQNFENYNPLRGAVELDYELYSSASNNFKSSNILNGNHSLHRIGNSSQGKMFSVITNDTDALEYGKKYVVVFNVKIDGYKSKNDYIEIGNTNSWEYARSASSYDKLIKMSDCKLGRWQKYTYTFTNKNAFLSFKTPAESNIYFDDIKIILKGYESEEDIVGAVELN